MHQLSVSASDMFAFSFNPNSLFQLRVLSSANKTVEYYDLSFKVSFSHNEPLQDDTVHFISKAIIWEDAPANKPGALLSCNATESGILIPGRTLHWYWTNRVELYI